MSSISGRSPREVVAFHDVQRFTTHKNRSVEHRSIATRVSHLDERLQSPFEWDPIAHIQPPDMQSNVSDVPEQLFASTGVRAPHAPMRSAGRGDLGA
jgi:chromosomal replication initiation ATPase DnaA